MYVCKWHECTIPYSQGRTRKTGSNQDAVGSPAASRRAVPIDKCRYCWTDRTQIDEWISLYPEYSKVDMATRFPEAIPLKTITTEEVMEELFKFYCRMGIPEKIHTDRGSQFTSDLMTRVNGLLIHQAYILKPVSCNW